MIFVILLLVGSFVLHHMCANRGMSPWAYLAGFVGGFFLVFFGTSVAILLVYGPNVISDPDVEKKIMNFVPVTLAFQSLLFYFFQRKIARIPAYTDDDDDAHRPPPPPPGGKKDLSYFR